MLSKATYCHNFMADISLKTYVEELGIFLLRDLGNFFIHSPFSGGLKGSENLAASEAVKNVLATQVKPLDFFSLKFESE